MQVDALIPCFNEAPRIGAVLDVLAQTPEINQIIVVDDGSSDNSSEVIKTYPKTQIISLPKNRGKGAAMAEGINKVKTEAVLMIDADLKGLTTKHVQQLITTYKEHPDAMILALVEKYKSEAAKWIRLNVLPSWSGQRIVKTHDLKHILQHPYAQEFGIETYMNYYFETSGREIIKIEWNGVCDEYQWEKYDQWEGVQREIEMLKTIMQTYINLYGKEYPKEKLEELKSNLQKFIENSE